MPVNNKKVRKPLVANESFLNGLLGLELELLFATKNNHDLTNCPSVFVHCEVLTCVGLDVFYNQQ